MKYFFNLGSNQALSIAEICSIFPSAKNGKIYNRALLLLDLEEEIDAKKLIASLGGVVKIGIVVKDDLPLYSREMEEVVKTMLEPGVGKFKYGISNYAKFAAPSKDKNLAMKIKNELKEKNISCRWVVGKERVLSSVIVEQNLLKGNGLEIVIAGDYKKSFVGRTLAVQAFKDLSYRDYGRPNRDDLSGMLPPKLAQIMINISARKKEGVLLDPFCGSGTIVTEALVMGYKHIIASDLSEKAVRDTDDNVTWIKKKFDIKDVKVQIFSGDARGLSTKIKKSSISAIVCEPYLGPQRGAVNQVVTQKELNKLYSEALQTFNQILEDKGRVVMIWPVRIVNNKKIFLSPDLSAFKKVDLISEEHKTEFKHSFSHRGTILYGRDGQKVWREIVVLEK